MKKIVYIMAGLFMFGNVHASDDLTKKVVEFVENHYTFVLPLNKKIIYKLEDIEINRKIYDLEYTCKDTKNACIPEMLEVRVISKDMPIEEIFKNHGADKFDLGGDDKYIRKVNGKAIKMPRKSEILNSLVNEDYYNNLKIILEELEMKYD